jgi:hypothetical protein
MSKKQKLFYVETGIGCSLMLAEDEDHAWTKARQAVGTYNGVNRVRKATKQDIAWVEGMGGYNPLRTLEDIFKKEE